MEKLTDFLAMDGYGVYVWPAFLIAAAAMSAMAFSSVRSLKRTQRALANLKEYE